MQTLSPCLTPSLQTAGDAVGAIGDLGVAPFAIAADDAAERWGCVGHCLVRFFGEQRELSSSPAKVRSASSR